MGSYTTGNKVKGTTDFQPLNKLTKNSEQPLDVKVGNQNANIVTLTKSGEISFVYQRGLTIIFDYKNDITFEYFLAGERAVSTITTKINKITISHPFYKKLKFKILHKGYDHSTQIVEKTSVDFKEAETLNSTTSPIYIDTTDWTFTSTFEHSIYWAESWVRIYDADSNQGEDVSLGDIYLEKFTEDIPPAPCPGCTQTSDCTGCNTTQNCWDCTQTSDCNCTPCLQTSNCDGCTQTSNCNDPIPCPGCTQTADCNSPSCNEPTPCPGCTQTSDCNCGCTQTSDCNTPIPCCTQTDDGVETCTGCTSTGNCGQFNCGLLNLPIPDFDCFSCTETGDCNSCNPAGNCTDASACGNKPSSGCYGNSNADILHCGEGYTWYDNDGNPHTSDASDVAYAEEQAHCHETGDDPEYTGSCFSDNTALCDENPNPCYVQMCCTQSQNCSTNNECCSQTSDCSACAQTNNCAEAHNY